MKNSWIVFATFLLFSFHCHSKTLTLEYGGFYDRLKAQSKGNYQYASVGFYLIDSEDTNKKCVVKSGKIVTEKLTLPLSYTRDSKLLLPFDKSLDADKAQMVIDTVDEAQECQLKMQIEAQYIEELILSKAELYLIHSEFQQLMADLSGVFIKVFMPFLVPELDGLTVRVSSQTNWLNEHFRCQNGTCHVSVKPQWQNDDSKLNLPFDVEAIFPRIIN
ncbi:DUF2987 domain-containing protein [Pseudoalteromonas sp. T1lg65]|uniref:DUF2987 domain-containing protein n=1 Tax=Pseudoalteromonas sp. T1lg65 TaxID=2077101 RepID=UPI003F79C0CB